MKNSNHHLAALAMAGLASALAGCGGSNTPADSAEQEPAGDKHGCKHDAEGKHVCGAEMKKGEAPSEGATAPAAPPETSKPEK